VRNLIVNMDKCSDWDNPAYYNIRVFKALEKQDPVDAYALPLPVGGTR
jgi:hypothetical protein